MMAAPSVPSGLGFKLPAGEMKPLGYVVSRYSSYGRGAAQAFQRWLDRAPEIYSNDVLNLTPKASQDIDKNRLAQLKDYRSLMPMAQRSANRCSCSSQLTELLAGIKQPCRNATATSKH